jgi:hypothetical protein
VQFIKYIGTAHRRIITADDFRRAGIKNQQTVEWSYENNFSVPVDDFPDDVLRQVFEPDPMFVVMGGDDHEPKFLGSRMTPAQAAGEGRVRMVLDSASVPISRDSAGGFTGSGPTPGGSAAPTTVTTGRGSGTDS